MRLAEFIKENHAPIIADWESFARTLIPAEGMTALSLRDHIASILDFIVADILSAQTKAEQIEKSHGEKLPVVDWSAAQIHAALRHDDGFNLDQMVSEYRALRASVIKLWREKQTETTSDDIADLVRFNESVDQELTESIAHYAKILDHSRGVFLGILSHDLRNPLGAILMSAQLSLMIGSDNLDERQKSLLSQIVDSTNRATEIVAQLLDMTRTRIGTGIPIIRAPMDIGFVSKMLVDEIQAMHPDRTFVLNVSGDTSGEWDKPRIGQVFSNLLINAVQYSFEKSLITVTVLGEPNEVIVSVHNDGIPIPENKLEKVFDSLSRGEVEASDTKASMNLGLGLYITKEIVASHEGTIIVASSEKEGTLFSVHFPKHAQPPKELPEAA